MLIPFHKAYLISFPKSGRTWLRLMLGGYLKNHFNKHKYYDTELKNISKSIFGTPKIKVSHDGDPHKTCLSQISHDKSKYKKSSIIFLVRDPRDVLVSLYYHEIKRTHNFSGTIHEFIHQVDSPLDKIIKFYNIWGDNQYYVKYFHLIKYEDLKQYSLNTMFDLLKFLNVKNINQSYLQYVIDFYSFENMKKIENEGKYNEFWIQPTDREDPNSFKTREGKIGSYVNHVKDDDIHFINQKLHHELRYFYSF